MVSQLAVTQLYFRKSAVSGHGKLKNFFFTQPNDIGPA
eukprot:gene5721-15791_t